MVTCREIAHQDQQENSDAERHAVVARREKRAAAISFGVTEDYISSVVEVFYEAVRKDDVLGPIFAKRIRDWPAHLDRMKAFWRSVLHNSGEFNGNPMLKHILIPDLGTAHFERWLQLFYHTLRTLAPSEEAAKLIGDRARVIADSLLIGIRSHRTGLRGSRTSSALPHV